jgi:hypothetical protein
VQIEEVNEGGCMPNLLVNNHGDSKALLPEGEELRGAKQNRVLNTSVLVAAHSTTTIPVSCVEQGGWRYTSRRCAPSDSHSLSKLRHYLKRSVSESLSAGRGHECDPMAVWNEISRQAKCLGFFSETGAMSDTFAFSGEQIHDFCEHLKYIEGATGGAIAVGNRVVALDLFDKASTCRKVWDRLLSGVVMDALESQRSNSVAESTDIRGYSIDCAPRPGPRPRP